MIVKYSTDVPPHLDFEVALEVSIEDDIRNHLSLPTSSGLEYFSTAVIKCKYSVIHKSSDSIRFE